MGNLILQFSHFSLKIKQNENGNVLENEMLLSD